MAFLQYLGSQPSVVTIQTLERDALDLTSSALIKFFFSMILSVIGFDMLGDPVDFYIGEVDHILEGEVAALGFCL